MEVDRTYGPERTGPRSPPRQATVCLVGLIAGGHSGVPRYAATLSRALDRIADSYPDLSLSLLTTAAGADQAKFTVVHSGPGLGADDRNPLPGSPYGGAPFLVYVGNLGPNKNLPFLVRSFDRARVPVRLILAGRARGGLTETIDAIAAAEARDQIEILGDVSDADLDRLYRSAIAVVLPSTYEGFGFTSLEAMSRGCPVLASDIAALREVSGSGAELLRLGDEDAWAAAIRRVVSDEGFRAELRARGQATVKRYSWERTARGVLDVFREAVGLR